jgi:alcohol dehydrogenase (NADP+)
VLAIGNAVTKFKAVKLAVARKAEVTVFTTRPAKNADAARLGARGTHLWIDQAAMARLTNQFDLLISPVPAEYALQPFIKLLKLDATLVNVCDLDDLESINGWSLIFSRRSIAGSVIGGSAERRN